MALTIERGSSRLWMLRLSSNKRKIGSTPRSRGLCITLKSSLKAWKKLQRRKKRIPRFLRRIVLLV
jgi:hypothetical protein